jgi:hypothetical protein
LLSKRKGRWGGGGRRFRWKGGGVECLILMAKMLVKTKQSRRMNPISVPALVLKPYYDE